MRDQDRRDVCVRCLQAAALVALLLGPSACHLFVGGFSTEGADAARLDTMQVDAAQADAARPDTSTPDQGPLDVERPDAAQPDTAIADAAAFDAALPDAAAADAALPDAESLDVAQLDVAQLDAVIADTYAPDAVEVDAATPLSARERFVSAYCGLAARCEGSWGPFWPNQATCENHLGDPLDCDIAWTTLGSYGVVSYTLSYSIDEGAAHACADWAEQADCSAGPFHLDPVCDGVFDDSAYLAQEGEGCVDALCGEGSFCPQGETGEACVRCEAKAPVGADCGGALGTPCVVDAYCGGILVFTCRQRKATGEACNAGQCEDYCIDGYCSPGRLLGQSCDLELEDVCAYNFVCRDNVCVERSGAGGICSSIVDCQAYMVCIEGQCIPVDYCDAPQVGQPCWYQCAAGAFCDFNTMRCRAQAPLYGTCTESLRECVAGTYCDHVESQTCQPQHTNGSICDSSRQCQSGLCVLGNCADPPYCGG